MASLIAMQEIQVQSLGREDPLEKGMATHSSIVAWRIPRTEEPGGLQFTALQRVHHDRSDLAHTHRGTGSLVLLEWQEGPCAKNSSSPRGQFGGRGENGRAWWERARVTRGLGWYGELEGLLEALWSRWLVAQEGNQAREKAFA